MQSRLCGLHNEVNRRLKKPAFDCAHLDATYDCGCGDDEKGAKEKKDSEGQVPKDDKTDVEMIRGG